MRVLGIYIGNSGCSRIKGLPWHERWLGGHLSIGHHFVLYGFNAMHVALNIRTSWGYVCFHPPMRCFGKYWPWYFYISEDGTPNSARIKLGGVE